MYYQLHAEHGLRSIKEIVIFDEEEMTEEILQDRAKDITRRIDELHKHYKTARRLAGRLAAIPAKNKARSRLGQCALIAEPGCNQVSHRAQCSSIRRNYFPTYGICKCAGSTHAVGSFSETLFSSRRTRDRFVDDTTNAIDTTERAMLRQGVHGGQDSGSQDCGQGHASLLQYRLYCPPAMRQVSFVVRVSRWLWVRRISRGKALIVQG